MRHAPEGVWMVDICVAEDVPWEMSSKLFYKWTDIPGSKDVISAPSVPQMVVSIITRVGVGGKGTIKHLFIGGHGADGMQSVGLGSGGTDYTGTTVLRLGAGGKLMGTAGGMLKSLAPYLAPDCVVTLGGCQVADTATGRQFLLAVSNALGGVAVQGSNIQQITVKSQIQGTIWRAYHGSIYNLGVWSKIPDFQPGTSQWPPRSSGSRFHPVSTV
jgi:hypothetical protein